MNTSTLTSKGQVTIPSAIRKRLGLKQGDQVAFVDDDGKIVILPLDSDIRSAFGVVRADKSVTVEEMDAAIRKRVAERSRR